MRRLLMSLSLIVAGVVACAAPPTGAPPPPPGAQVSEWDRIVEAAKKEGSIAVLGPTGDDRREALTQAFEKKYGITVEYLADAGPGIPPKVAAERGANQYIWDVFIGGTTTGLEAMIPMGAFDPIEPALIRPEVKDPAQWRGGEIELLDPGRTLLVMTPFHRGTIFTNTNLVQPGEIKSHRDLLDPKWRGKLLVDDPRKAGAGQATFTFFYLHPDLGPDFIRALARQELQITRDYPQQIQDLGQGRYPVLIGTSDALVEARIKLGVPISILDPRELKESTDISPASGAVALMNKAPHPNAARVYLDWLLGKEGQTNYAQATGYVSKRLDVPTDHTQPWRVPLPNAIKTYDQAAVDVKEKLIPFLEEVFGR